MITERRRHVVVNGEMMRNVDVEARCQHLQPAQTPRREIQRLTGRLVDKRLSILIALLPTGIAYGSEVGVFSGVCLFVCLSTR